MQGSKEKSFSQVFMHKIKRWTLRYQLVGKQLCSKRSGGPGGPLCQWYKPAMFPCGKDQQHSGPCRGEQYQQSKVICSPLLSPCETDLEHQGQFWVSQYNRDTDWLKGIQSRRWLRDWHISQIGRVWRELAVLSTHINIILQTTENYCPYANVLLLTLCLIFEWLDMAMCKIYRVM